MSKENVELVRRLWEQFEEGLGDQVVLRSRQTATGRESGVPVELKLWQVADLKDGRLIRMTIYLRDTDALEAAGLRE